MQPPLLIVNPFASAVSDRRVAEVTEVLGDVEVRRTEHPGHATELAREARGRPALYVLSGDGVFNEALNGLDADVPIGFIPGGGANVLPRALGLPRDPVAAARKLVEGNQRRISLGRVNGRRFAFAAGIGLTAEVVRRVDRRGRTEERGRSGNLMFALTVVKVVAERRARFEPALEVVGEGRAAFALVANCDPVHLRGGGAGPRRTRGSVRARPRPGGAAEGQRRIGSTSPARTGHGPWPATRRDLRSRSRPHRDPLRLSAAAPGRRRGSR